MTYNEIDNTAIQSFEYETTMISDGNVVGTCELGKATIQLLNDSNKYSIFKDSWIKTIHGSFYIYSVEPVQEKVNIKLNCYDIKYKLDSPYDSSKHSFPCTLKAWRNSIFNDCNVEYDDSDFPNSDLILASEPYIEKNSRNRTVIKMIAQAGASAVITDSNDKFYFTWFEDVVHDVTDWIELTTEKQSTIPINLVVLGRGDTEDNVYYPEDRPDNPKEFRIDNNYILDPQDTSSSEDLRYVTRVPIYNRVKNFSYLIFNMRSQQIRNKLSIKLGQKIKFLDIWNNELTAYVMTKKINWLGGSLSDDDNYEIILSASELKESSTDLNYASNLKSDILRVERKTDKNEGLIEDVIEETKDNTNKITQTITNINNIQNLFQITGGNNLIKNSVGLFKNENWIESEEGTFEYGEDSELIGVTTSISKITVSNGTLTTSNENIVNLTLNEIKTLSFKIKQDSDTTTTITLWGLNKEQPLYTKTFTDQISYWTEIYDEQLNQFYADSSNLYLEIKSESQYGGKFYISDLILNNGDKTEWSLASGEVNGTIVKLSQLGISVYAIEGNYVTMMTTEGLQIRSLVGTSVGNIITQFIQNGLLTIDIEQTGKHIQKNLVHDVINSNGHEVYVEYIKG